MAISPCERCGTGSGNVRMDNFCVWCYAVVKDRPAEAEMYGEVTDFRSVNPQKYRCPACDGGVMEYRPHHHARDWGAHVCGSCEEVVDGA